MMITFFPLSPLPVLCTGALSVCKLPLNEHVSVVRIEVCMRNDDLVDDDHIFPLSPLPVL